MKSAPILAGLLGLALALALVTEVRSLLPPPQWIEAAPLDEGVALTWIQDASYLQVRVERRLGEGPFESAGETEKNFLLDAGPHAAGQYTYRLVGIGAGGEVSPPSQEMEVTIFAAAVLAAPPRWEGYLFVRGGAGLKWSHAKEGKVMATNVYRRRTGDPDYTLLASTTRTSYLDADLEPGEVYSYVLTAIDASFVESPRSEDLSLRAPLPEAPRGKGAGAAWKTRRTRLVKIVEDGAAPLFRPADVAAVPGKGLVYLSEGGGNAVQVFTREGVYQRTLGGGTFARLLGIDADADGRLFAVDSGGSALVVLDPKGAVQRRVELGSHFAEGPLGFVDAAVGVDGRIFVVDNLSNRVSLVGAAGFDRSFGEEGFEPGRLSAPTFCTFDSSGRFYLSDTLNGRVQIFDSQGELVRAFGRYGQGIGGLARPKGVAVSSSGEIYVADSWQNVIQVFDGEGRFLAVLTDEKDELLDLGSPNGIALEGDRRLYIAERLADRLQIREIIDGP